MKKYRKLTYFVTIGLFLIGISFYFTGSPFKLLPGYYAKEFCSCYFVVHQTKDYCMENSFSIKLPTLSFEINEEAKSIKVANLMRTSIAQWQSERFGCVLTN
ncbi:MAG: hypothetical protein R3B45_16795 [Bdellovibrionota bacterium]